MSLSLTQKENLYYELAQSLQSGISFATALKRLSEDTGGSLKKFIIGLSEAAAKGDSAADAFARQRPGVTDLETSILAGSERSGRLEQGCRYLAAYFAILAKSRSVILKGAAYPFLLLHLAILAAPIRQIMGPAGFEGYKTAVGWGFLEFYAGAAVLFVLIRLLLLAARETVLFDRLVRLLPLFGKVRKAFSLGRFCGTYEMQLQSGVNVMDSLTHAGKASQSAVLMEAVRSMLPKIRGGEQVGPLMTKTGAFPQKMVRSFRLGEETGKLDEELKLLTENFQKEAMARIDTLSAWIPKLLYLAIGGYVVYVVISFYMSMLSDVTKQMDQ